MVQDSLLICTLYCNAVSVRQKAKEIIEFLQDDERLRSERRKAKQTRDKFVGYSSDELTGRYSELENISYDMHLWIQVEEVM